MSAEIKALPNVAAKINADTVALLHELHADAAAGEIESVLVVVFRPNGDYYTRLSAMFATLKKIGALETLKSDLIRFAEKGD